MNNQPNMKENIQLKATIINGKMYFSLPSCLIASIFNIRDD